MRHQRPGEGCSRVEVAQLTCSDGCAAIGTLWRLRERLAGVAREISELLGKCASSVKRILLQRSMLPWCRLAIYCASVLCSNPRFF